MKLAPIPPKQYERFHRQYPKLKKAYKLIAEAGKEGPLDERTTRFVKLGIVMGAMKEAAIRANVRKALSLGISREEIEQAVCLATRTLGLPSTVAIYSWVQDVMKENS